MKLNFSAKYLFQVVVIAAIIFLNPSLNAAESDLVSQKRTIVLSTEKLEGDYRFEIGAKILSIAYSRLNIDVQFLRLPAARSLHSSASGKVDGEMFRYKDSMLLYPQLLLVDVPIVQVKTVALYSSKNISIKEWADLKPYLVVNRLGYKQSELIFKKNQINFESVNSTQSLVKMVALGRADIAVGLYADMKEEVDKLQAMNPDLTLYFSNSIATVYLNHFLHEKNKDLVPLIEEQLKMMQANGEIEQITLDVMQKRR